MPAPVVWILFFHISGSLSYVGPAFAVHCGWVPSYSTECVPSCEESISTLLVVQPDVDGPSVEAVEEHRQDLQLGTSIVNVFDLVGAS